MKNILVLGLILFSVLQVSAQDAKAKAILDKVSNKVKQLQGFTADFTYTTKNKSNVKKGSVNGTISIKGQKYYIKQGTTLIICDGKRIWNYGGENEVTVSDADQNSKTLTPQKLLTNFYDNDFTYRLVNTRGNFNEIEMEPLDKRKNFKKVNIFINKASNMVTRAKIIDKGDNIIEFELKNINTKAKLSDALFVFDVSKYMGIEVIEQ